MSCQKLIRSWLLKAVATAIVLISCTKTPPPSSALLVGAATSLQPVLQSITPAYRQAYPDRTIDYNFSASGILQQQIERGIPIDVFISAAEKQMKALQEKGLLRTDTVQNFLTNQLVLITPKESAEHSLDFRQLVKPEIKRISIGEPRTVPAGEYAMEVFRNLGIVDRVRSKLIYANNVKAVLTAVEMQEVDAGIVYITDAKSSEKVTIAAIADSKLHSQISYQIAILKSSLSPDLARQYINFLRSSSGKDIFKKYGFTPVDPERRSSTHSRYFSFMDFSKSFLAGDWYNIYLGNDRRL